MSGPFAKTILGPPAPLGTDTSKGALLGDVQNGVAEMVDGAGNTHGIESTLKAFIPQTALTTVTTAQNFFSVALNAFQFNKLGRLFQVTGQAVFTTANAATFTIALTLGGVTLCSIVAGAATAAAITNGQLYFNFVCIVVTTGASATLETHGSISVQLSGTTTTAVPQYMDGNTAVSSAVNLTAAANLIANVAASAAVSSITLRQCWLEVIN